MKNKQLNIRLTEEQEQQLIKKAEEIGLSKGEYVRYLIIKNLTAKSKLKNLTGKKVW